MRVVCIPPSLPTSPAEPRLGEVWSREGALVAMATGTAFLPRRRRRRRPQDFRAKPLPTNFSSPETQPGALGHPWGTLGKHQPLPAGKQDLEMGSSSVKALPVPSRTGRLVQRPLVSRWRRTTQRTGRIFIGSPPFQGLSGPVDSQGGCTTSQRALNTRILGNHPFFLNIFPAASPESVQRAAPQSPGVPPPVMREQTEEVPRTRIPLLPGRSGLSVIISRDARHGNC